MLSYWMKRTKRSVMPQSDIDQQLLSAVHAGIAAKVSEMLACGSDPRRENCRALREAAGLGYAECVRVLLPVSDPKAADCHALRVAAGNGQAECVRLLLPVSDANADESLVLRLAACNGHSECVRMLLPLSNAKAEDCHALQVAARNGHAECVRMLLPVSGPLGEIDGLLEKVLESGHANVAALLIEEEPRLLDGVDLSKCLAGARENGHGGLAAYLSSIIEQKAILGVLRERPARTLGLARL